MSRQLSLGLEMEPESTPWEAALVEATALVLNDDSSAVEPPDPDEITHDECGCLDWMKDPVGAA